MRNKNSVNWKIAQQKLPSEQTRGNRLKKKLKDLGDYNKRSYICVIRVPEGKKEREQSGWKLLKK